jgi:predicted ATPase/DNA-binding CsgD family transcriptional regulator
MPTAAGVEISEREAQVLTLLGEHLTNAEIGARLFISARTVESHVGSLLRKLGAADRRALAGIGVAEAARRDRSQPDATPPPLPSPLTSFLGRRAERAALADAVGEHRLVTALGSGGVGKTRLALAVAGDLLDRFADGVWYADLVPVTGSATVATAMAVAVGLGEQIGRSPTQTVVAHFGEAEALVVLDNCEHVVDGVAGLVEALLTACPNVRVLATSQVRLLVPFERPFPVVGLSTGADDSDGGDGGALFVERAELAGWARSGDAGELGRIAALCRALDGNALAIELAAARAATIGLDGLEAGLTDRLDLLAGGPRADMRHRSVRSAVAWSYGLLADGDRAVLRRCSVFAAPFNAAAAVRLAGDRPMRATEITAALGRLAEHSLLVVVPRRGGTRYRMLETVRQYGHERLAAVGDLDDIRARHLAWCSSVLAGLHDDPLADGADEVADNARAALQWAGDRQDLRAEAQDVALHLAHLAFARGRPTEAQHLFGRAARLATGEREVARALHLAAVAAACRYVGDDAVRLHRGAADAAVRVGDRRAAALDLVMAAEFFNRFAGIITTAPNHREAARLVGEACELAADDPDLTAAIATAAHGPADVAEAEVAIARAAHLSDPRLESAALDWLISIQLARGELIAACRTADRRLELLAPLTHELGLAFELSDALHTAALTSIGAGRLGAARRFVEQRRHVPFLKEEDGLVVEGWLVVVAALSGAWDEVVELDERYYTSIARAEGMSVVESALPSSAAAMVYGLRGDRQRRRRWLDVTRKLMRADPQERGDTRGYGPMFAAMVTQHAGDAATAAATLADDPAALDTWRAGAWRQWYAALWAEAGVLANLPGAGERIDRARQMAIGNPIAGAIVERTAALAANDADALLAAASALEAAGCRYQQARTLVLAGGDARIEGRRILDALGAAP